jgi:hypothetical protein
MFGGFGSLAGRQTTGPLFEGRPYSGGSTTPYGSPPPSSAPSQNNPFYGYLGSFAPLPYQAFGAIPQIQPSLVSGGDIGSQLGPYGQAVYQAMAPYFAQQQQTLNEDLNQRGIYNSGAANYLLGNLLAQQQANVLGAALPYAQQNLMSNQQAINQALASNAAAYGNVVQGNENLYNSFLNQLLGANLGYGSGLANALVGSYGPNPALYDLMSQQAGAYSGTYGPTLAALGGPLGQAFTSALGSFSPPPSTSSGVVAQPVGV